MESLQSPTAGPEFAVLDRVYSAIEQHLVDNFEPIQEQIHGLFLWGPCLFAVVSLGMIFSLHWREVWDITSIPFPKYMFYNSWENSNCKSSLDRTLVFVYHCCWGAVGVYALCEFIVQYAYCDIGPVGPHKIIDRMLYPLPMPGGPGACKLALHNAFLFTLMLSVMLLRIFSLPSSLLLFSGCLIIIFGHYGMRSPLFSTLSCSLFGLSSALLILQLSLAVALSMSESAKAYIAQPKKDVDSTGEPHPSAFMPASNPQTSLFLKYSYHYPIGLVAVLFMSLNIVRTPQLHDMCIGVEKSDLWTVWLSNTLQPLMTMGVFALIIMNSNLLSHFARFSLRRKKRLVERTGHVA